MLQMLRCLIPFNYYQTYLLILIEDKICHMTRLMILKIMYVTQTPCTTAFAAYPKRQDVRLLKKYSFCEVYLGHVYRRQTWCLIRLLFSELSPWLDAPSRIIILCFFQENSFKGHITYISYFTDTIYSHSAIWWKPSNNCHSFISKKAWPCWDSRKTMTKTFKVLEGRAWTSWYIMRILVYILFRLILGFLKIRTISWFPCGSILVPFKYQFVSSNLTTNRCHFLIFIEAENQASSYPLNRN